MAVRGRRGYTMDTCEKDTVGTEITLELLDDVAADAEATAAKTTANSSTSTEFRVW